jgi:hypothetical protein
MKKFTQAILMVPTVIILLLLHTINTRRIKNHEQ